MYDGHEGTKPSEKNLILSDFFSTFLQLSRLKRRLRHLGIKRRALQNVRSPLMDIEISVRNEFSSSDSDIGY